MSTTNTQPTNTQLWQDILSFDFDHPVSEYGFTTRLIHENLWTKDFAERSIQEYRKFMYLAAVSDSMVSPSPVIDTVWHQHLIFTQSYNSFCRILGKFIQHVPSTHNKEEFSRFKQAKEITRSLYAENFGAYPADIWDSEGMLDNLSLPKASLKIRGFVLLGILGLLLSIPPLFYLLRPLYVHIDGGSFLLWYAILWLITFIVLRNYNQRYLSSIINGLPGNSFLFKLNASEAIFLKTGSMNQVIDNKMNHLYLLDKIDILAGDKVVPTDKLSTDNPEEFQVRAILDEQPEGMFYMQLRQKLKTKPVFSNVEESMNSLQKYFTKSKIFSRLFRQNFFVLAGLLSLGIVRIVTGIVREKPTMLIIVLVLLFLAFTVFYLYRLPEKIRTSILPTVYKSKILPERQISGNNEWAYFLIGAAALHSSFYPAARPPKIESSDSSSDHGSSCGSDSGGSSCGSSCGGCGGD
ncbi:MAG: hypothetical protein DI535_12950 [Citrobacter freundii]|nr:MAG: hypothetical protein DI535_12950 [Citrobacter freundii]